jgi:hypothetical protein
MRPSRDTILERFRACAQQLGKAPGLIKFCRITGTKEADVYYYWSKPSDLAREVGFTPNEMNRLIPEDELFKSYASACAHLNKIPTTNEFRIVTRELNLHSYNVYAGRYEGGMTVFKERFKKWLENGSQEYKSILDLPSWETFKTIRPTPKTARIASRIDISTHRFLPATLQHLDLLSRGEKPFEDFAENVNTAFEKRCGDAFRCLGFEVQELGQGRGRKADCLALARQDGFGVIIDAKVRTNGYVLGTEDRKFLEYAVTHSHELLHSGLRHVYFAVIGSEFREDDLKKLTNVLAKSPIRSVDFITAKALMRMVEQSIRERFRFRLAEIDELLFGNKIIPA